MRRYDYDQIAAAAAKESRRRERNLRNQRKDRIGREMAASRLAFENEMQKLAVRLHPNFKPLKLL